MPQSLRISSLPSPAATGVLDPLLGPGRTKMAQNLLSAGGSWEFLAGSGLLGFEGFGASGIWGLGFRSLILGSG